MRHSNLARALALLSVVALATSCDFFTAKKDDGTFTMALSDATLGVGQGKKDTVIITLTRSGFTKPIALTVTGLPTGVTGTMLPPTVPGGSSVSGLELTIAGTAALATTTLTVHATADGVAEQTATVDITVGLTGTYTLSSYGFPVVAAQGGGATGAILVVRAGGHGDNVTLAASGMPSGVTASFYASPTASVATSLSFAVGAAVTPGDYPITITGTAPGLSNQTTSVTLTVIAPPATALLSMPFCASSTPVWFAYQNRGSPWQTLTAVNGVYSFQATATLSVAYAFVTSTTQVNESNLNVLMATRAELAGQTDRDCAGPKNLTGSVSGLTTGQSSRISMGATIGSATAASTNFTLTGVYDRTLDLVATKGAISSTSSNLQLTPDLIFLQRGLNPTTGTSVGALDFAGNGFAPTATSLTIGNLTTGDNMNVANTFWSSTSTYGVMHAFQPVGGVNTLYSMPAAKILAGDQHELLVETYQTGFAFGRVNVSYLGALADRTELLAPNLSTPSVTAVSTTPYVRLRGLLPVQAEYPTATRFIFFQDGGSSADRLVYIVVTNGFLGGTPATNWEATIPEFGSVSGLNTAWLPSSSIVIYQAEAYTSPGPVLFGGVPSIGDVVKVAYRVASNGSLLRANFRTPAFRAELRREIETRQYLRR